MDKYTKLKDNPDEIIFKYIMGLSCKAISLQFDVSEKFISNILTAHEIPRRTAKETNLTRYGYSLSGSKFQQLITEEDLYFLGYILADGCISNGSLNITINQKDKYILKKLQSYLGMVSQHGYDEREVYDKRTGKFYSKASLTVKDETLVRNLNNLGITPRKSAQETITNSLCKYNRHFWRGVVDGDGHIYISKQRSILALVGSEDIVQSFIDFCIQEVGLETNRIKSSKQYKNCTLFKVQLTGNDARNVAKYLYNDTSLCLTRKQVQIYKGDNNVD